MKFFGIGLGLGSLAGLGISLLPNPQTGHKVKDDVRLFLNDTKNDTTSLATSTKQAKSAADQLITTYHKLKNQLKTFKTA